MSKPFFYRITAADFLAAVVTVPEADRSTWVLSLALDMVSGDCDKAQSEFAKTIIAEAAEFSEKKRSAANKRWNAKDMQTYAVHSTAMPEAVTEAVTVHKPKPLSKNKSTLPENFQVSERVKLWAEEKGHNITTDDLEDFTLHHRKVGSKFVDWDSALMTWMRNKRKFSKVSDDINKPRGKKLA